MTALTFFIVLLVLCEYVVMGCLVTNCKPGGKRNKPALTDSTIKPCVNCGPGRSGQCFGPNICCGPFGCLLGTPETIRCQRNGFVHEREPCIAGSSYCRRNTGRCAFDGICCSQDSCHTDETCSIEEKPRLFPDNSLSLYNFITDPADVIRNK